MIRKKGQKKKSAKAKKESLNKTRKINADGANALYFGKVEKIRLASVNNIPVYASCPSATPCRGPTTSMGTCGC